MKKIIYLFLFLSICNIVLAQTTTNVDAQKRAVSLFYQGDVQSALPLFWNLYKQQSSDYYYQYLLQSQVMVGNYAAANKLIKQHYKHQDSYQEPFDRAYLAYAKGQMKVAQKTFRSALQQMPVQKAAYVSVANHMRRRALLDWAEELYHTAQQRLPNESFHFDLASLYQLQHKHKAMTEVLVELLAQDERQLKSVQYRFQNLWQKQEHDSLQQYAQHYCLLLLQKQTNKPQLREFLLWMSIQQQNFDMAELQAAALDRQKPPAADQPSHLFSLSRILLQHHRYSQTQKILHTMLNANEIEKSPWYPQLWQLYLQVNFALLKHSDKLDNKQVDDVKSDFQFFQQTFGCSYFSLQTATDYADFLAHYDMQKDSAIAFLQKGMGCFRILPVDKVAVKLYLANLYQEIGQPWEAILLYAQIEKAMPHENIAAIARYKNALLSLYLGETAWAEAQLDVLKAATDKKIANDAMKLSLFIKEANKVDTSQHMLHAYGRLIQNISFGRDSMAYRIIDSLLQNTSERNLCAFFKQKKAHLLLETGQKASAILLLEDVIHNYSDSFVADEAIWMLAEMQKTEEGARETVMNYYKLLITKYPSSFFTPMARQVYQSKK